MMMLLNPMKDELIGRRGAMRTAVLPATIGFALARAARALLSKVTGQSVTMQNVAARIPGGMLGDVLQGALTLLVAVPIADRVTKRHEIAQAMIAGAVLSPLAGFVSKLGPMVGVDLGDYSIYDTGASWNAMTAAYYPPMQGDYPTEVIGDPGDYNTAAVGLWDDSGYPMGDEALMVQTY